MRTVPLRVRARTVDHLGREQIADGPTAVSELWKNAYDAYARNVALHLFEGAPIMAAVVDNGHGMSREEFEERWLVLDTDAKAGHDETTAEDRCGLPPRVRQGQKGIGRLSAAYLGPLLLVLSKRVGHPFVVSLIDWRVFENPYLLLEDIRIPVESFSSMAELATLLPILFDSVVDNVWGRNGEPDRNERVARAWARFDALQREQGRTTTASEEIVGAVLRAQVTDEHLEVWPVWRGEADHGTGLLVLCADEEFGAWFVSPAEWGDQAHVEVREAYWHTLRGFVDPFAAKPVEFDYSLQVHRGAKTETSVSAQDQFGLEDIHSLEHFVDGRFDEFGVFRGRVRAFGRDLGDVELVPARPPSQRAPERVGPFDFCIGTFEQKAAASTHTPEQHAALTNRTGLFAGLAMHRDGLRLMPYGRPEADFFGIEERRGMHAGRYFWSFRRSFGRLAITRDANPTLRDKAGREGLIANRARRELRILVMDLLKETAARYFGTDAELRKQVVPENVARHEAAQAAEAKLRARHVGEFRDALRANSRRIEAALARARKVAQSIEAAGTRLAELEDAVQSLLELRAELKLPPKPAKLGRLEEPYRAFRDHFASFSSEVDAVSRAWSAGMEALKPRDPAEVAASAFGRHQKFLHDQLREWQSAILRLLEAERNRIEGEVAEDRKRYFVDASGLVKEAASGTKGLSAVLNGMESCREELHRDFAVRYNSYLRALRWLADGIELDSASVWGQHQREELEARVDQLHSLAQLGITVEIVSHELVNLDETVVRSLRKLPREARELAAYRDALGAHEALAGRLRLFSQISIAGHRLRDEITGDDIAGYVQEFYGRRLEAARIRLVVTESFRKVRVTDFPFRILPVFINLVNNAAYWLTFVEDREILLDAQPCGVYVADSGRGVDPDDVPLLFTLFFSRKVEGRGVGLYLCRQSLAAGGHSIDYVTDKRNRVLPGANFIIRLRGQTA